MDYYAIGQRIRRIRKARGLSQEQLAEQVGISVTHMSHIETANTKLSLPVFVEIARALEVQTDHLLYDAAPENTTRVTREIAALMDGCSTRHANILLDIVRTARQSLDIYG